MSPSVLPNARCVSDGGGSAITALRARLPQPGGSGGGAAGRGEGPYGSAGLPEQVPHAPNLQAGEEVPQYEGAAGVTCRRAGSLSQPLVADPSERGRQDPDEHGRLRGPVPVSSRLGSNNEDGGVDFLRLR